MNFHSNKLKIALVGILMLALLGCTVSTVIGDIQFAVNVVAAAAPIIAPFAGTGSKAVVDYVVAAANGLNCSLTAAEVAGATTATVAAGISGCLSTVLLPSLPIGTPQVIVGIVAAIGMQISTLMAKYGLPKVGLAQPPPTPVKMNYKDHKAIHEMHKQLNTILATIAAKK